MKKNIQALSLLLILLALLQPLSFAADKSATVDIQTVNPMPLNPGFSGFNTNDVYGANTYKNNGYLEAAAQLHPGWLRFPAGTASDAYNWKTGEIVEEWARQFEPDNHGFLNTIPLLRAKGGITINDFKRLCDRTGAKIIICVNAFTDSPASAGEFAAYCLEKKIKVEYWELANEAYILKDFSKFFPTGYEYARKMKPYSDAIKKSDPNAKTVLMFSPGRAGTPQAFDDSIVSFPEKYWDAVSYHKYNAPVNNPKVDFNACMKLLNGILAHDTNEIVDSYYLPRNQPGTAILITEFNAGLNGNPVENSLYNGVYVAEYILRLSTHPNVKHVGLHVLSKDGFTSAIDNAPKLRQIYASGKYPADVSGWDYGLYFPATGLALKVINEAVNHSTARFATMLRGGSTVAISGYDNKPIPALFALAYLGNDGRHYLVVTNKSAQTQQVQLRENGQALNGAIRKSFISSADPTLKNTAASRNTITIQEMTTPNPVTIPPYSVVRLEWGKTN